MRFAAASIYVKMTETLASLRDELNILVGKQQALDQEYCAFAFEECGLEEETAKAMIAKAVAQPQKNKRLKAICEAHEAVLAKQSEITEMKEKEPERKGKKKGTGMARS